MADLIYDKSNTRGEYVAMIYHRHELKNATDADMVATFHRYFNSNPWLEAHMLRGNASLARLPAKKILISEEEAARKAEYAARIKAVKDEIALREKKSRAFDRMVEALDAISVGDKLLGDCTGGDLLREAVQLEAVAHECTAQSAFYRQLAAIVGKTTTVREANDRDGIVGLITSRMSNGV